MGKKTKPDLRPVPKGLSQAVAKALKHIDGRYVYGLPHYGLNNKMKIVVLELGDMELFEENEIDVDENPNWIPFAMFKSEPQFLAIGTQAPYPVSMWEHEDGKFYTVWATFDDFVSKVIDKKDKTPFEKLDKQLEKISDLVDKDSYADALGLIEPIMKSFPKMPPGRNFEDDSLARAHNLHGLSLKGVKRWAEARAAFEASATAGDTYAELNILDLLEDEKNPRGVIEYGLSARDRRYFDDYGRVWVARYLGFAYLDVGETAKAEEELRRIVDGYAVSDPEKVEKAREGLEKYVADNRPGTATAREYLAWFKPKSYDVTPDEAKANREWWTACPEGMQKKLLEEVNVKTDAPSDQDIARCLDAESLDMRESDGMFDDKMLPLFLKLQRLDRLSFYGDPDSIEVLRGLPKLDRLTINNTVIKQFTWPSRANRDLWAAAKEADRKGIDKALAAGASLSARGYHGYTALFMVALKHDSELLKYLVSKGSDPWAGNNGESRSILNYMGPDDKDEFVQLAAKAGIPHPEGDPFRELGVGRIDKGASFEVHGKLELEHDHDDGESLKAAWPSDVKLIMEAPKKDNKLGDFMRLKYRTPIVSERVAEILRGDPNIELLPVTLLDHSKKPQPGTFYVLNPLLKNCLVVEKCYPGWNHINPDSMTHCPAYVIDAARTDSASMFRLDLVNSHPLIVTKALADKLKDFSGVHIQYLKR